MWLFSIQASGGSKISITISPKTKYHKHFINQHKPFSEAFDYLTIARLCLTHNMGRCGAYFCHLTEGNYYNICACSRATKKPTERQPTMQSGAPHKSLGGYTISIYFAST